MRRTLVTLAAIALAGFCFASAVPAPVFGAKKASARYHSQYSSGTRALYASRFFRCKGGRYYTWGGGWGCDYYVYSYDWPLGRQRRAAIGAW